MGRNLIRRLDGSFTNDPTEMFKNHLVVTFQIPTNPKFDNIFYEGCQAEAKAMVNMPPLPKEPIPSYEVNNQNHLHSPILVEEVEIIQNSKSTHVGPNKINRKIIKHFPRNMIIQITEIFNSCLVYVYFPTAWTTAYTIMIRKPGKPPDNPKSYRPIPLLDCIGKILDKLIANRQSSCLESRNILSLHQNSASDAILKFQAEVTRYPNSGAASLAILLNI